MRSEQSIEVVALALHLSEEAKATLAEGDGPIALSVSGGSDGWRAWIETGFESVEEIEEEAAYRVAADVRPWPDAVLSLDGPEPSLRTLSYRGKPAARKRTVSLATMLGDPEWFAGVALRVV